MKNPSRSTPEAKETDKTFVIIHRKEEKFSHNNRSLLLVSRLYTLHSLLVKKAKFVQNVWSLINVTKVSLLSRKPLNASAGNLGTFLTMPN